MIQSCGMGRGGGKIARGPNLERALAEPFPSLV
jgi:hypothetical protein